MAVDCLSCGILVADHLCDPIPAMPGPGELVLCRRLPLSIGGCASNVAVDLARLGANVGVVGCVGKDIFGGFILDTLCAAGVKTEHVRRLDDQDTSTTLIVNVVGEDRRFIHSPGASTAFAVEHIPIEAVRDAKVLYLGGYLLMPALDAARLADLFRQARAWGVRTVLDVVVPGAGEHWPNLLGLLPHTDVFLPNEDEATVLTGLADPVAQAERFCEAGARTAVITCGRRGSVLVSDKVRLKADVFPVEYRGGTGSGDAFDAGYIRGLLLGEDEEGCLRWGSAVGASCVRAVGATDSVFTLQEAEAFLRKQTLAVESI